MRKRGLRCLESSLDQAALLVGNRSQACDEVGSRRGDLCRPDRCPFGLAGRGGV